MPRMVIGGLTLLLCLAPADSGRSQPATPETSTRTVIALYGFELHTPNAAIIDRVLHREFVSKPSTPAEFYSDFMDVARFAGPAHEARFAASLHERYADRQVDLLLSPDPMALRFLLKHRAAVFPRVPVVFLDFLVATLAQLELPHGRGDRDGGRDLRDRRLDRERPGARLRPGQLRRHRLPAVRHDLVSAAGHAACGDQSTLLI